MAYELPELLDKLRQETSAVETHAFFLDLCMTPRRYGAEKVREYQEQRRLGQHLIPREGAIVRYTDNDNWSLQTEAFKRLYPELSTDGPRGVVDIVKGVALKEDTLVELVVERYLIRPKN